MEIREIHLKHFGKFEGQKLTFHSGVNVIYGENETGKSTICSFIRGMLFGLERARGRAAKKDEYKMREPWENAAYYAGGMRFVSGGKRFYLNRSFTTFDKHASLICEDDGEELDVEQGDLSALLEDISEETYQNTFYLGNRSGETDAALAEEIHNYLVNAAAGNDARINVTRALESLKKDRKALETEKRTLLEETRIEVRDLQKRMEYEEAEIAALLEDEKAIREEQVLSHEEETVPEGRTGLIVKGILTVMAVAGLLLGLTGEGALSKAVALILIFLACIGIQFCASKEHNSKQAAEQETLKKRAEKERLQTNLAWIVDSRREKEEALQVLQTEMEQLQGSKKKTEKLDTEIAALKLAETTLLEVMTEIYQEYEDRLNERVSQILSIITDGKYDRVMVDEKLNVRIYSEQRILTPEQLSRGTMEQICFALRIAAGEMLNPGEPLPVILDDAFLTYDDERLKHTLQFLSGLNRQVLIFTCQKREQLLLYEDQTERKEA